MRALALLVSALITGGLLSYPVVSLSAADTPPAAQQDPDELDAAGAQKLLDVGNRALRDSNETPSRAVDAALAFTKALAYYERQADTERICELEAAIFWCKKRMNIDDVKRFLAAKGGSKVDEELLAAADQVATKKVSAEDAQAYFDRAEKFARENPTAYGLITARYFEVAERFAGSEIGKKAHGLSLAAQKKDMELLAAERRVKLETVFSRPEPAIDDSVRVELPSLAARKVAVAELRKERKADYAKKRPAQRERFIQRLTKDAKNRSLSPEVRAALLDEALDVAGDLNNFAAMLAVAEQQALTFRGATIRERQREALASERTNPSASALLKLLDDPLDSGANLTVGRYYCLELARWDEGVPMLARGGTSDLSEQAAMELIKPEGWMQQVELADRWYNLGKKTHGNAKQQMSVRSYHWYSQAQPNVSGITRERIMQRLEELADLVPMENVDYAHLTAKQWDRLPGKAVELAGTTQRNDIGLVLKPGLKVRIVPHPTERLHMDYHNYTWPKPGWGNMFETNSFGRDKEDRGRWMTGEVKILIGAIVMAIEKGEPKLAGVLEGTGRVYLGPFLPGSGSGKGVMRVKVLQVEED